ncbi:NADH-quinone oxidoreductase subunit N [Promineifilum sp.]|uniref:NADH-quinone oxidoreductase subunit N n=1 Tax=Promineifilum sp. TaxID=2664178 RepID=UPI0035B4E41F
MDFQAPAIDYLVLLPLLLVAGMGMLLMFIDLLNGETARRAAPALTVAGLFGALISSVALWDSNRTAFTVPGGFPMLVADNFAMALNVIFAITGILTVLLAVNYLQRTGHDRPEFYMLMLFSLSGMMLMGMANDLILIFLALELLSIPLYIMAGLAWPRPESEESAMKYFVLGAFSSAIFVYGIALIYGATGTTALPGVVAALNAGGATLLALAGAAMILVGFGFKVAAAPFHMWTPDVYEGAPTVVTAFMSVGAKVGGFAALLRILIVALPMLGPTWTTAVSVLAALTMIVGNFLAIVQPNIKRMLGYSSIAHAGYILIAVAASATNPDGVSAALFYMFAYAFTNLGAFAVAVAVERKENVGVLLDDYKGLAKRYPWIAIAMAFFMLSLTGVPPTGGFAAKFFVFRSAIESGLLWLTLVGVVTSVISGYYYLRVVFLMYMYDGEGEMVLKPALVSAVVVAALATLLLGLLPGTWFDLARQAVMQSAQALAGG